MEERARRGGARADTRERARGDGSILERSRDAGFAGRRWVFVKRVGTTTKTTKTTTKTSWTGRSIHHG